MKLINPKRVDLDDEKMGGVPEQSIAEAMDDVPSLNSENTERPPRPYTFLCEGEIAPQRSPNTCTLKQILGP